MKVCVQSEYTSVACNRVPSIVDWNSDGLIIYGASNAVLLYDTNVRRGDPLTVHDHHKSRVNQVKWLRHHDGSSTEFVSSSNDKTAAVWSKFEDRWKVRATLDGHGEGVTYVDGVYLGNKLVLFTTSIDSSIKVWELVNAQITCTQTIILGSGLCITLKACLPPFVGKPILFAALDDHKIYLYASPDDGEMKKVQVLIGHEDWVRGMDVMIVDETSLLLATCSQDTYIRLWRLQLPGETPTSKIEVEEKLVQLYGVKCSIKLDAVLSGHEGWVYGVQWHPPVLDEVTKIRKPVYRLLSTSMDKTTIIWEPETADFMEKVEGGNDEPQGAWVESVRVGEVGGMGLGFYGACFGPKGEFFLSHGYNGSFHVWRFNKELHEWQPNTVCGGHFSEVIDMRWEKSGKYLCSVSYDQTTRVHARRRDMDQWFELARPQVHGYDMSSIALISSTSFVSAAEEKVLRVFEAPYYFVQNFISVTGNKLVAGDYTGSAEGATVPSLDLSNKAVYDGERINTDDKLGDVYFVSAKLTEPPTEETLMQNTLWPETHKLYGHGYEVFCCDATADGALVASACKATTAEHCAIIIWETKTWKQIQKLQSHSLTVTQLAFAPNSQMLLSVSRDRKWSLFERAGGGNSFEVAATTDKTNGVHSRIIWSCAWAADSSVFATCSRDGKICLWSRTGVQTDTSLNDYGLFGTTLDTGVSVTALAFAPIENKSMVLATGFDNGIIRLYNILASNWDLLYEFDNSSAHHLTVKRLFFKPKLDDSNEYSLASCGSDHLLRIHKITFIE